MAFAASLMKEYGGKSHMQQELLDKHFFCVSMVRNAYYGQEGRSLKSKDDSYWRL